MNYFMIFGAEPLIYLMLIFLFLITIKGKIAERKAFILFLISLPILILLIKFIHLVYFEPRPYITNGTLPLINHTKADAAFPSRHTSIAFIMALPYFYYKSKWATILILLATWVGISRIYVGVHYPLDIIGGVIVGIFSNLISLKAVKLIKIRFFR